MHLSSSRHLGRTRELHRAAEAAREALGGARDACRTHSHQPMSPTGGSREAGPDLVFLTEYFLAVARLAIETIDLAEPALHAVLTASVAVSRRCAEECENRETGVEHCRRCSMACRRCERACVELLGELARVQPALRTSSAQAG